MKGGSQLNVFERMAEFGHEQVIFCHDQGSGMRAIIAVHNTALGPARGGTRYANYASEEDALEDALRLARGMTYKFAWTDMPRGGAKAVLMGSPDADKAVQLRVYGRHVELLAGRFGTGPDYGTGPADIAEIARETRFVWGTGEDLGGTGDSSPFTAEGVMAGILASLDVVFGSPHPRARSVALQGLGAVGGELAERLVAAGATVVGCDVDERRASRFADRLGLTLVAPEAIYEHPCDVFSPNARGGTINQQTIRRLRTRIVAGGANNQLGEPADGHRLHARGILYAPDYVINSAGAYIIAGRGDLGYSDAHVRHAAIAIGDALRLIYRRAAAEDRPTAEIADVIAEERIAAAARSRALAPGPAANGAHA
jgi:glutamate dehydrogenase/leucine dehydrogenase